MLFGHQNDVNQPQPQATEPPEPGYIGPQDQPAQTVVPQDPVAHDTATSQDPVVQSVATPQVPAAGVNPLAVDPATGASLPAVPADSTGPVDTPSPVVDDQPSVLDQPSAPGVSEPEGPEAYSAPEAASTSPVFGAETTAPDPGTPFSATTVPDPAPVLDQAEEAHEAAAIAQELDTPGEEPRSIFAQATDPSQAVEVPAGADVPADPQPTPAYDEPAASAPTAAGHTQAQANSPLLDLKQQAIEQLSPLISHLDQNPEEKFRTTMMLLQSTDNPALLHDAYSTAQAITDEKVRAQALLDVVNEINYFTQQQDAHNS